MATTPGSRSPPYRTLGVYSASRPEVSPGPAHSRSASESAATVLADRDALELRPLGLSSATPWPEVQIAQLSPRRSAHSPTPLHAWPSVDFREADKGPAAATGNWPSVSGRLADLSPAHSTDAVGLAPDQTTPDAPDDAFSPQQPTRRVLDPTWLGRNGRLALLTHWAYLSLAEFPMTEHRQWLGLTQRPKPLDADADTTARRARGSLKRRLLLGMGSGHRRFIPLVSLEEKYASNRKRRRLMYALQRHHTPGSYRNRLDALCNEAFIASQLFFDRCTPRRMRSHLPWFTAAFLALSCVTFAFMAGEYPAYLASHPELEASRICPLHAFGNGPQGLAAWVYRWNHCHKFDSSFMVLWGASWAPKVNQAKEWWRWGSSLLLADSFPHAASNALLFGVLGMHLESRFTTLIVSLLVVIAGLGGNFFDAAFRGVCTVIISAAGCTFGLLGLFIADFLLNFEAIRYPVLRLGAASICVLLFILAMSLLGYPYRLTPIGGFLSGLFPSLLFLPHLKTEMLECWIPPLTLLSCIGFIIALPLYIYLVRFPDAQCD